MGYLVKQIRMIEMGQSLKIAYTNIIQTLIRIVPIRLGIRLLDEH